MESVVLNFLKEVYDFVYELIDDFFGNLPLIKGALLVVFWAIIIGLGISFIFSFWYDWKIPVGIIVVSIIIEILTNIGKNF